MTGSAGGPECWTTTPQAADRETKTPRIGIVTVSDRVCAGTVVDRGGPAVAAWLEGVLAPPFELVQEVVPDERPEIEALLRDLCDVRGCCLVLTTGGTGPAPRDVTPEATEAVGEKSLPGFGEVMRRAAPPTVPTALLARQAAVVRGRSLIVNLPGSPRAVGECLDAVFAAVPHAIQLRGGPILQTRAERLATRADPHPP